MPKFKPPPDESPDSRFRRLAKRRTEEVISRLRILRNCSNRKVYEYTPSQVETIFKALQEEIDNARRDFIRDDTRREIEL